MLDLQDYKTATRKANTMSHEHAECAECRALMPKAHLYTTPEGRVVAHVLSEHRFGHLHETVIEPNGFVRCTCEHGVKGARGKSAHCLLHIAQAERLFFGGAVVKNVTPYELFDEPLELEEVEVARVPAPAKAGRVTLESLFEYK